MIPQFVELNDRVFLAPQANSPWERPDPMWPRATVVGFRETCFGYFRRTGVNGLKPGVYRDRGMLLIRLDGSDTVRPCGAECLAHADPMRYRLRLCDFRVGQSRAEILRDDFLRDLPDTPFWEGDIVRSVKGPLYDDELLLARVVAIDYGSLVASSKETERAPAYVLGGNVNCDMLEGAFPADAMALVRRGPVWKRAHGEEVTFPDVLAETELALQLGAFDRVFLPGRQEYSDDEAARYVAEGYADGVISGLAARALGYAGDGKARYAYVYGLPHNAEARTKLRLPCNAGIFRLHDRDLARRYARATFEAGMKG